jgi:hypothetical protein
VPPFLLCAVYLRREAAPLVLSVFLWRRDASPRWKSVVEPVSGRFTHHLELGAVSPVDPAGSPPSETGDAHYPYEAAADLPKRRRM